MKVASARATLWDKSRPALLLSGIRASWRCVKSRLDRFLQSGSLLSVPRCTSLATPVSWSGYPPEALILYVLLLFGWCWGSRINLGDITQHNVKQLKLLNSVVFPVSYTEKVRGCTAVDALRRRTIPRRAPQSPAYATGSTHPFATAWGSARTVCGICHFAGTNS